MSMIWLFTNPYIGHIPRIVYLAAFVFTVIFYFLPLLGGSLGARKFFVWLDMRTSGMDSVAKKVRWQKKVEMVRRLFNYESRGREFKVTALSVIAFRILYALFESVGQYVVWAGNAFTQLFLPPHQSIAYYAIYSGVHYWLNGVFAVSCGAVFFLFLKFLRRHNDRFFEEGEVELGALIAVIVGWPNFVSFLLIVFPSVVLVSIIRRVVFGELYTTLGAPFLLAGLILLIWGDPIGAVFHLTALSFPRPI